MEASSSTQAPAQHASEHRLHGEAATGGRLRSGLERRWRKLHQSHRLAFPLEQTSAVSSFAGESSRTHGETPLQRPSTGALEALQLRSQFAAAGGRFRRNSSHASSGTAPRAASGCASFVDDHALDDLSVLQGDARVTPNRRASTTAPQCVPARQGSSRVSSAGLSTRRNRLVTRKFPEPHGLGRPSVVPISDSPAISGHGHGCPARTRRNRYQGQSNLSAD